MSLFRFPAVASTASAPAWRRRIRSVNNITSAHVCLHISQVTSSASESGLKKISSASCYAKKRGDEHPQGAAS